MKILITIILISSGLFGSRQFGFPQQTTSPNNRAAPANLNLLSRHYRDGEVLAYRMIGSNKGYRGTIQYEAQANGVVKKNSAGIFIEQFGWANPSFNNNAIPLSQRDANFRQSLSLDTDYKLSVPDLSQVTPMLIAPITDLLAFYADLQLAIRQEGLKHAGDHVYVKYVAASSWADGANTLIGEDSIDFDITLTEVAPNDKIASLVIRHVPPEKPQIKTPAEWMHTPIADKPNNWIGVQKNKDGKYDAEIGKETFDVQMRISLVDGKILSGIMDNPVEALRRECSDGTLANCGDPIRYQIRRRIELRLEH